MHAGITSKEARPAYIMTMEAFAETVIITLRKSSTSAPVVVAGCATLPETEV